MNYWIISMEENCLLKKFTPKIFFDDNKIKNASYDQDKGFGLEQLIMILLISHIIQN